MFVHHLRRNTCTRVYTHYQLSWLVVASVYSGVTHLIHIGRVKCTSRHQVFLEINNNVIMSEEVTTLAYLKFIVWQISSFLHSHHSRLPFSQLIILPPTYPTPLHLLLTCPAHCLMTVLQLQQVATMHMVWVEGVRQTSTMQQVWYCIHSYRTGIHSLD